MTRRLSRIMVSARDLSSLRVGASAFLFVILLAVAKKVSLCANGQGRSNKQRIPQDDITGSVVRALGVDAEGHWTLPSMNGPSDSDYASNGKATIRVTTDTPPRKQVPIETLINGRGQRGGDDPENSVFFDTPRQPIRILMDLGSRKSVKEVDTFSWHVNTRANQFYHLYYSSDDDPPRSDSRVRSSDLKKEGWNLLATVHTTYDTTKENQVGVRLNIPGINLRYLLWDVHFAFTFWGEFDVFVDDEDTDATPLDSVTVEEDAQVAQGVYGKELHLIPITLPDNSPPSYLSSHTTPTTVSRWAKDDGYCAPLHDIKYRSISHEDEAIFRLFYTNPIKCNGTVVEVGASDGFSVSPSYFFGYALNWTSVLVEPNPDTYKSLVKNPPDATKINAAFCSSGSLEYANGEFVANTPGKIEGSRGSRSISSTDTREGFKHPVEVPCISLSTLFQDAGVDKVDILFLRQKGDKMSVLRDLEQLSVRVSVWVVELDGVFPAKDEAVREKLHGNGYVKADWDIREACPSISEHCLPNEIWLEQGFQNQVDSHRRLDPILDEIISTSTRENKHLRH